MSGPWLRDAASAAISPAALEPFFAGHFPGRPILPGVAHLALVERVLSRLLEVPVRVGVVASLRLRRPLGAGDAPSLTLLPLPPSGVRFAIRRGEERASEGTIGIAGEQGVTVSDAGVAGAGAPASRFPEPAELLPHAPPARLLEALLEVGEGRLEARAVIPSASPFAEGAVAPGLLALELGAQAAAALEAIERAARGEGGGPRQGYLVGAREARFDPPLLPVGVPLRVSASLEARALPLCHYRIGVACGRGVVASAMISTYLVD